MQPGPIFYPVCYLTQLLEPQATYVASSRISRDFFLKQRIPRSSQPTALGGSIIPPTFPFLFYKEAQNGLNGLVRDISW